MIGRQGILFVRRGGKGGETEVCDVKAFRPPQTIDGHVTERGTFGYCRVFARVVAFELRRHRRRTRLSLEDQRCCCSLPYTRLPRNPTNGFRKSHATTVALRAKRRQNGKELTHAYRYSAVGT